MHVYCKNRVKSSDSRLGKGREKKGRVGKGRLSEKDGLEVKDFVWGNLGIRIFIILNISNIHLERKWNISGFKHLSYQL